MILQYSIIKSYYAPFYWPHDPLVILSKKQTAKSLNKLPGHAAILGHRCDHQNVLLVLTSDQNTRCYIISSYYVVQFGSVTLPLNHNHCYIIARPSLTQLKCSLLTDSIQHCNDQSLSGGLLCIQSLQTIEVDTFKIEIQIL